MKKTVPDILNCLANLSSDEVFTSPELANQMLDMLPQDLFSDPTARFLDPCSKSGVFLREIAKRLMVGLEEQIPDLQQRIDHIMGKQLFGIALTQLTAEMSRRTLYCAKKANGEYSVAQCFGENGQGNLRYMRCEHIWANGKCSQCGANRAQYDRVETIENYAYPFIHKNLNEIFKNMQFDVIIGNPPYQMSDGGGTGSSAVSLYHQFVLQAKKLNPRYLSMIIPARWYSGGKGLDEFRATMLNDNRISHITDFFNATDCFPGVDISGGVCYFLWERDYCGECLVVSHLNGEITKLKRPLLEKNSDSFIRFNQAIEILRKIQCFKEDSFSNLISARKPFGEISTMHHACHEGDIKVYAYPENQYTSIDDISTNKQWITSTKVFVAKAYGERGNFPYFVIGKPFIGELRTCCTETYLLIGPTKNEQESENIISYMRTKFFRFFVLFKKNTQNAAKNVYQFVPLQDFSHPWTDEMLYEKYGLSEDEIAFIESMIKPME